MKIFKPSFRPLDTLDTFVCVSKEEYNAHVIMGGYIDTRPFIGGSGGGGGDGQKLLCYIYIWASSRQNLSSGFPTK